MPEPSDGGAGLVANVHYGGKYAHELEEMAQTGQCKFCTPEFQSTKLFEFDGWIVLHQDHSFDLGITEEFGDRPAIAAAYDEGGPDVGMNVERHMYEHLALGESLALSQCQAAVYRHRASEILGFEHVYPAPFPLTGKKRARYANAPLRARAFAPRIP